MLVYVCTHMHCSLYMSEKPSQLAEDKRVDMGEICAGQQP